MPKTSADLAAFLASRGKFEIHDEITEGANSYAFGAQNLALNRKVFLKVYDYVDDAVSLREPQLLVHASADPGCDNLVRVFDAEIIDFEGSLLLCLQMEYVPDRSLYSVLQDGPVGQQDAVRLCRGACHGVAHLHSCGLVHRDLKPANIVRANNVAKLSDFGSVTKVDSATGVTTASQHSVFYAPPEALTKPASYYKTSDVYQVGALLHELVSGPIVEEADHYVDAKERRRLEKVGTPYPQMDDFDKTQVQNASIRRLAMKKELLHHARPPPPYLSRKIRVLISRATAPDPADRPSAAEFEQLLSGTAVPNWVPSDLDFQALNWSGWDWRVTAAGEILRSRPNAANFRRYTGLGEVESLQEAFAQIEKCG